MTDAQTLDELIASLRERDDDPAYADAPVLDAYARISRNPDTGEMEKTDRQLMDVLRDIERRGARLGAILRDDNISAWKKGTVRPGWNTLVARLTLGHSNGVVCWATDRLMRQPRDLETLIDLAENGDVSVYSCVGEYDLTTGAGRLTLRILTAAAASESDSTSRRQLRKMQARREAGHVHNGGPRPFGFPGKGASAEDVAKEREAIAWAIQAHVDGKSLAAIVVEFRARGLVTVKGNEFIVPHLKKMLMRASNAGLIEYGGVVVGRMADGEPIVSEELFNRLRSITAARTQGRPAEYLLGGVLKCSMCGTGMSGTRSGGRVNTYSDNGEFIRMYRCVPPTARRGACGGKVSVSARQAERYITELTLTVLCDPDHAAMVARQSESLAKVTSELDRLEATAQELSKRLGAGMPFDRYDVAITPIDARIATLTAERDALVSVGAGEVARVIARDEMAALWDEASTDERRALIKRAFPKGVAAYPGGGRWGDVPMNERLKRIA